MAPILPQTSRGTWALAAAAWAVATAAAWWLIPPRPRAEWHDVPPTAFARIVLPDNSVALVIPPASTMYTAELQPLLIWDAATGKRHELFTDDEDLPRFEFSPDGRWLLVDHDNRLHLWDTGTGKPAVELTVTESRPEQWRVGFEFSADGRTLAYSDLIDGRGVVRMFDLRTLKPAGIIPDAEAPLAFAANGGSIAYRASGECRVVDRPGGTIRFHLPDHGRCRYELSPAGDQLFRFMSNDATDDAAECWDVATGTLLWEMPLHDQVSALSGDKCRLFTGGFTPEGSPNISLWDARAGQQVSHVLLPADERFFTEISFLRGDLARACSPTDPTVVVVSENPDDPVGRWLEEWVPWSGVRGTPGRVRLVDVITGRTVSMIPGGVGEAYFTPDGRGLVVRSWTTVRLWDLPPHKPLAWFAVAATLLALPVIWLVRRLRSLAGAVA